MRVTRDNYMLYRRIIFPCQILCSALAVSLMLSGCAGADNNSELISSDSDSVQQEMKNREYLSDKLKSWEIFSQEISDSDGDSEREPFVTAAKDAIAAESTSAKIEITVRCPSEYESEYRRMAGEFKWQFADDDRYLIDVNVVTSDAPNHNADVFIYNDRDIEGLVSSGKVIKVNDKLKSFSVANATAESIDSCTFKDKQYGFPLSSCKGNVLLYDKSVLSWESLSNLEAMIETANEKSENVYIDIEDQMFSNGIFLAAGCEPFYDGTMQTADYNSDKGLNAAKTLCSISKYQGKGLICSGDANNVIDGFSSKKICAAIVDGNNASDIRQRLGDDVIGIACLPTVKIAGNEVPIHSFSGYDISGVSPNCSHPFTAQLFAYYISRPRSQIGMYYSVGSIPSADISEYMAISEDPLFSAAELQKEYTHIFNQTISSAFEKSIGESDILSQIREKRGDLSDQQLKKLLSSIPEKI